MPGGWDAVLSLVILDRCGCSALLSALNIPSSSHGAQSLQLEIVLISLIIDAAMPNMCYLLFMSKPGSGSCSSDAGFSDNVIVSSMTNPVPVAVESGNNSPLREETRLDTARMLSTDALSSDNSVPRPGKDCLMLALYGK
ncbi:hypothetical protein BJ165DRAFT_1516864 [Panaeolus papilionaceus]|nr:hypothetical protein BJ165DRAFT_1516864 [Panaeolus papilionaceus]